jgi:hypothetical protein
MIELSVIRDIVAIFGVIAGFTYYVITVRTSQKNQQLAINAQHQATETRKIAIYNSYVENITTQQYITAYLSLMYEQQWENFDDWWEKYGGNNPKAYNAFIYLMLWLQNLGMLYEQEMIEIEMLFYDRGWGIIRIWERLEPLIEGYRVKMKSHYAFYHAEKLYNDLKQFEARINEK